MTSAWLSLARVAPVGAVTTHLAASAVSATKASPRTTQAVPVKVELGFGWSPGPGLQSRGPPGKPSDPVRVSQTWMSVTGPTAASTAVRMSWGATAVAALRASPRTPSGASVWVSVRGWEEAGAPLRICPEWATGNHTTQDAVTSATTRRTNGLAWEVVHPPTSTAGEAGESGGLGASLAKLRSAS